MTNTETNAQRSARLSDDAVARVRKAGKNGLTAYEIHEQIRAEGGSDDLAHQSAESIRKRLAENLDVLYVDGDTRVNPISGKPNKVWRYG